MKMATIGKYIIAFKNWLLCQYFPFLYISEDWAGRSTIDRPFVERYATTFWDDIPEGWRKAFGWSMIRDIREVLVSENALDEYEVYQVKEKWGALCWYDNRISDDLRYVKHYYEELSEHTCIVCGQPAEYLSTGWICPFCVDCKNKHLMIQPKTHFVKIKKDEK